MKKEIRVASYMRVGNYEQIIDPIDYIRAKAKRGEIQTLLVGTLERVCEDPVRRKEIIKELTDYGVEIVTAFNEEIPTRKCAIYNRYSIEDNKRMAETRERLIAYCADTLGITDFLLFEEVGSVIEKREVFDDMMEHIEKGEFTDLLVNHIDRIFKPAYDSARFIELIERIQLKAVIHIVN